MNTPQQNKKHYQEYLQSLQLVREKTSLDAPQQNKQQQQEKPSKTNQQPKKGK